MHNLENKDKYHYLKTLNLIIQGDMWLPLIDASYLEHLNQHDKNIVITNDWVAPDGYAYGAWTFVDDKIIELQQLNGAKIANKDGEFIFELGSSDHKGLMAIEIEDNQNFFILHQNYFGDFEAKFYFPEGTDEAYIEKALKGMLLGDEKIIISRDQKLSVSADEYKKMILEHSPTLI